MAVAASTENIIDEFKFLDVLIAIRNKLNALTRPIDLLIAL